MLTPTQRSLRGRIGAYSQHARHDPRRTTSRARSVFLSRFLTEVDPDGKLPLEERLRRAASARKAHMTRLAFRSALARRAKAQRRVQR